MNRYRFDNTLDAKGKEKHLHTLDGVPLYGTSTVVGIVDKSTPFMYWAVKIALGALMGWTHPKLNGKAIPMADRITPEFVAMCEDLQSCSPQELMRRGDGAYTAHVKNADKAADKGVAMHSDLEQYIKFCIDDNDQIPMNGNTYADLIDEFAFSIPVDLFADWASRNVKRFISSEGHCYSEQLQTGGIVDLAFEDFDGNYALLDFKSAKADFSTHFYQNAGYDIAIQENGILTADGELVWMPDKPFSYYLVLPYGMSEPSPQRRDDVDTCKEAFRHCVGLYKIQNAPKAKAAY